MSLLIRLDESPADRALIDQMWRVSLRERCSAEQLARMASPTVESYPTARLLLVESAADTVAMAGAVLPGRHARYGFEARTGFPCDVLPTADRSQLGTGLIVYVRPAFRSLGLGWVLTFLCMALVWDAGATYIAAENGGTSLKMALATGYRDTGLVTMTRDEIPYHLTVGRLSEVILVGWRSVRPMLDEYELSADLGQLIERVRATAGESLSRP